VESHPGPIIATSLAADVLGAPELAQFINGGKPNPTTRLGDFCRTAITAKVDLTGYVNQDPNDVQNTSYAMQTDTNGTGVGECLPPRETYVWPRQLVLANSADEAARDALPGFRRERHEWVWLSWTAGQCEYQASWSGSERVNDVWAPPTDATRAERVAGRVEHIEQQAKESNDPDCCHQIEH
jgi:hypothetical protein